MAERVTAIIADQIRYEINLVRGVEKEVLDLSDKLQTMRNVLDDAEKRGVRDESVKGWLRKLEDLAYEVDDILDEWIYALLKHKLEDEQPTAASPKKKVCCSFVPSSCLCFKKVSVRRDTAKKIENVKAKLDQILKEKDEFNFVISLPATDPVPTPWRLQSTSSIELEKVHGKDVDRKKNEIVSKLMMSSGEPQILSIVGMGGIGKTTLAQLVYNDDRVKQCFESKIWICVSDPFDVAGIAKGIVDSVGGETIPPNTNQLEIVLQKLRESVSDKKFLLVLDDVWTEDYNNWEPLKINLKYGAPGSKILVTTRNEKVARMMGTSDDEIYRPQELTDEECWSLLRHISLSGKSDEECGKFKDVGMKIAGKCKGLPLAANVLGSHLQFKNSLGEWENVLESEIWQLEKVEVDLFPHLVLSYNELSPSLKRCFSFCAIFPKDSEFKVEVLIDYWTALGYLGSDLGNDGMEIKGREYFNNLAMRSLFQNFKKSNHSEDEIVSCQMHDIVHDFAQFLRKIKDMRVEAPGMRKKSCQVCNPSLVSQAREYRSLFVDEESLTNYCDCFTSLRVLMLEKEISGIENFIHLRMLVMEYTVLSEEDMENICKLYLLQSLSLSYCSIEEIPKKIENLIQLRKLELSYNDELNELPESMCNLLQLQTLNIEECTSLCRLPEGIHRLQGLKHLNVRGVKVVLPQGVGQLSGLHTLSGHVFQVGSGWNKMGLLKKLNRLSGSLSLVINNIGSTRDLEELVTDAREAELRNKEHLQTLQIEFVDCDSDGEEKQPSSLWVDVIEALEPNNNLKYLQLTEYLGQRLPRWISSPLNLLREMNLKNFSWVSSLPPVGKLPLLETLTIHWFEELKVVGVKWLGIESSSSSSATVAFPKLKKLEFSICSRWEEWEDITAEEEESAALHIMPSLTHLEISYCSGLKMLPHRLLRKARSLEMLDIVGSRGLINCYGDKDGDSWRSIRQFHPQLQLVTTIALD